MTVLAARARWPRRRPGVHFDAAPPRRQGLPRMDVAMLVGFAESGPLDVPVPVEDVAAFEDIFGRDAVLARDRAGAASVSRLGATVRSFFSGGGRRAWIVRVAGRDAETDRFEIPGLLVVDGGAPAVAIAHARSPGSWADDVSCASALVGRPVTVLELHQPSTGTLTLRAQVPAGDPIRPGDLVRVDLRARGLVGFVEVRSAVPSGRTELGEVLSIAGRPFWFATAPSIDPGDVIAPGGAASIVADDAGGAGWALRLEGDVAPEAGRTVRFTRGARVFFLVVETTRRSSGEATAGVLLRGPSFEWLGSELFAGRPPETVRAPGQVSTLELWAKRPGQPPLRSAGLGFCPEHALYWPSLPSDDRLFLARLRDGGEPPPTSGAPGHVGGARFPLAGEPGAPRDPALALPGATAVYLPLGVPASPLWFLPASRSSRDGAARSGLDRFSAEAFLDEDLTRPGAPGASTAAALLAWAEYRQYTAPDQERRHLRGIFAAFGVPEVSLVAVPDALSSGWGPADDLLPPAFEPPSRAGSGRLDLRWRSDEASSVTYVVEERYPDGTLQEHATTGTSLSIPPGRPPGEYRYRVRADHPGPIWSAPLHVAHEEPREGAVFDACAGLVAAELVGPADVIEGSPCEITWPVPAADPGARLAPERLAVETSSDARFTDAAVLYEGSPSDLPVVGGEARLALPGLSSGDHYFRLRSMRGAASVVSTGVLVRVRPRSGRVEIPPSGGVSAAALRVHEHLLRTCAARGDLLGVLALPSWYREDAALEHAAALLAALGETEPHVLSFGAIYHPWLVVAEGPRGELRSAPPDGAACAMLAATAASRGAWIAAANQPLRGVLGLAPPLSLRRGELTAAQINVVVRDPRGFLVASEDTLALVPELVPIHTRRTLVLLRRAALELGATYAFEPNGAALERAVERAFGGLLRRLHEAGALAGKSEASAFKLDVASGTDARTEVGAARFSVDIAVAPAGAIEAITVRLVQTGARGVVTEGV